MDETVLIELFRGLDRSVRLKIANERAVLRQCLAILAIVRQRADITKLTASEISKCAYGCGFNLSNQSIANALSKNTSSKYVIKHDGPEKNYEVSIHGEEAIEGLIEIDGPLAVYVEANTPYSTRKNLKEILKKVCGDILVVDPYLGEGSFKTLELLAGNITVRMITSKVNERDKVVKSYGDFKKEHPNVEIRIYTKGKKELHDRYILSNDYLVLTGHGIKDIGNRESFVIILDSNIAADNITTLKEVFEERWSKSVELS